MFERYTEKARRVIFYARYEASQYGSPYIESEHILLGLLREDGATVLRFLRPVCTAAEIRVQIESQISVRERISTSVEVPLTQESKQILNRAKEEADLLGDRHIETQHLLLGILATESSFAARLLLERGAKLQAVREQLAKDAGSAKEVRTAAQYEEVRVSRRLEEAATILEHFLAALKSNNSEELASFFAQNAQFVDFTGRRWNGRDEITKQFESLLAPYAKKNVACRVEGTHAGPSETVVANATWENVTVSGQSPRAMHRMTFVLASEGDEWAIYLLLVTPLIAPSEFRK
ncbi:MAG: SgcJ/EcaC family oxidoreductase [Candidatus Acidiferrales bacterium]